MRYSHTLSATEGDDIYTLRKKSCEILLHGVIPVDVISFEKRFTYGDISKKKAKRVLPKYYRKSKTARQYWIDRKDPRDYEGFFIAYGGFQNNAPVVRVENENWIPEWMTGHEFEDWAFSRACAVEHVGYLKLLRGATTDKKVWTIEQTIKEK